MVPGRPGFRRSAVGNARRTGLFAEMVDKLIRLPALSADREQRVLQSSSGLRIRPLTEPEGLGRLADPVRRPFDDDQLVEALSGAMVPPNWTT